MSETKTAAKSAQNNKTTEGLQKDLNNLEALPSFEKRYAEHIRTKMLAGLRKDQAIEVIKSQIKEDLQAGNEPHYKTAEA